MKGEREPSALRETWEALNQYWFGYGTATALGLFRIVMGTLMVIDLLMLSLDWDAWYSERGFMPSDAAARFVMSRVPLGFGTNWTINRIGILNGITDSRVAIAIYAVAVLLGVLTALGLWTRVSSILFAVFFVSIHHRNAAILHGGDTLMRSCVIYMAIAPSGAACSLDRLIGIWKGKLSRNPVLISMWPQRLISYNVAILYLTTTWLKWGGGMWRDGTATYYPARLSEFYRFPMPHWINDFPFVYVSTYGTLFTEFAMGTLVFFRPLRKYVLLCGLLMHFQIEVSMNIPLFSYLMTSTYITFFNGEEVSAWAKRLGQRLKRWQLKVAFPAGTRLTANGAGLLEAIDPLQLVTYGVGTGPKWSASDAKGRAVSVPKAIWTRSLGSWLFGWIPGVWDKILPKAIEADSVESEPLPAPRKKQPAKT